MSGSANPNNIDPDYGDLSDPVNMLTYKSDMAESYRRQMLKKGANGSQLTRINKNIFLLDAQTTALLNSPIVLQPPTDTDIKNAKEAANGVDRFVKTDAVLAAGLALLDQVASVTLPLIEA